MMTLPARKPVMVGLGEILWDLLPTGKALGGAPANFAYHAHALGAVASVVSTVGRDYLGQEILQRLDHLGVDRDFVAEDSSHPTGTVSVHVDKRGIPEYIIHEDVAWDFIPYEPGLDSLAAAADAVCFGSLGQRSPVSRTTIQRFLAATRPECQHVLDINLRQHFYTPDIISHSLELAHILKLNEDELPVLAAMLSLHGPVQDQLSQLLQRYQLKLIALTRGSQGAILQTPHETADCPGFSVAVADTVGAGDAFTAAMMIGLLSGRPLPEVNRHACRIAAFVCAQHGATPAIRANLVADIRSPSQSGMRPHQPRP